MSPRPVILYLHGFASSPESRKGRAFAEHLGARGYAVERLDLRRPDRNRLRVSVMIDHLIDRAGRHERVVVIGSSLGGLVAAHAAAKLEPRLIGLVLMAPAFDFARRWGERLDPEAMASWRAGEPLEVEDHAGGPMLRVDYGFYEDATAVDRAFPAVTVPTLVFHGREDDVVDFAGSEAFARQTGQATLVALQDGHALTESLPVMLPRALEFIDRLWRTES